MQNIDATGVLTQGYARMFLGSFLEESVAPERYKFTSLWNNIPVPIPRSQMKEKEPGVFRICSYYCCLVAKMCPNSCDPMDCSTPGSSVYGIFQARILEWVAISSSREAFPPRDRTCISGTSCLVRWILYHCATWEAPLREKIKATPTPSPGTEILFDNMHQASTRCQTELKQEVSTDE